MVSSQYATPSIPPPYPVEANSQTAPTPLPDLPTAPPSRRPTLNEAIHVFPRVFISALLLLLSVATLITGIVYMFVALGSSPGAEIGKLILILVAFILFTLLGQHLIFIYKVFTPPANDPTTLPNETNNTLPYLPPWLTGRLPTYVDAVGGRSQVTGDVEDSWIVGESLPVYGQNRGSKLLLRSQSRGGAVRDSEILESVVEVVEMREVGMSGGIGIEDVPAGAEEVSNPAPEIRETVEANQAAGAIEERAKTKTETSDNH